MSHYATKKELEHATDIDTSDLTVKKIIALKAEVGKQLDLNKLSNVPTSLNNLRTEVDDLDVAILKVLPVDLKTLSDVVDNKLLKTKTKGNNLEKKIPVATTLIHRNQYNTDKQNLEQKWKF